jgi:hypothetical protein
VLPVEAPYAYVELKASLQSTSGSAKEAAGNSIEACLKTNRELRGMRKRSFWAPVEFSSVQAQLMEEIEVLGVFPTAALGVGEREVYC